MSTASSTARPGDLAGPPTRLLFPLIGHAWSNFWIGAVAVLFAHVFWIVLLVWSGLFALIGVDVFSELFLSLLAFLALLLNGVFEDGREPPGYPRFVRRAVEAAVLSMPAYAAIALYGTGLRVSQYGLTPARVHALLFVGVASVYALGYAAAVVIRRPPWLRTLRSVNVGAALLVAALLVQLPVLDPLRLSAHSQEWRLRSRRVAPADFDFAALRFELGRPGWEALGRLEELDDHPRSEEIRRAIAHIRAAESPGAARGERPGAAPSPAELVTLPGDLAVPGTLLQAMTRDGIHFEDRCRGGEACRILGADFDADGTLEYCFLAGARWWDALCYAGRELDG